MKKLVTILIVVTLAFISCSKRNLPTNNPLDYRDFFLRNGKVFFKKDYFSPSSFKAIQAKLTDENAPNAGFKVKKIDKNKMNGVIINYNLNVNITPIKLKKVPTFLRSPMNATFQIEKKNGSYQVIVNNIWFSNFAQKGKHLVLEDLVTEKNGWELSNNKKKRLALDIMNDNFAQIFQSKGGRLYLDGF